MLIRAWHHDTNYHLIHHDQTYTIKVTRGIRQGCRLAPILWACYFHCFFAEAAHEIPRSWLETHINVFADDFHFSCLVTNWTDMEYWISACTIAIRVLQRLDLTISASKPRAIVYLHGRALKKFQAKYVRRSLHGKALLLGDADTQLEIPITDTITFLGISIAYHGMAEKTIQFRVRQAKTNFRRLQFWLSRKHGLSSKYKLQIFKQRIIPATLYGAWCVPLQRKQIMTVVRAILVMYRRMIGDHAYYTKHSHEAIIAHYQLPKPLDLLRASLSLCALGLDIHTRHMQLHSHDVLHNISWHLLDIHTHLIDQISLAGLIFSISPDPDEVEADPICFCPVCRTTRRGAPNLRRHLTNIHHLTHFRSHIAHLPLQMEAGIPKCAHCHKTFKSWRNLRVHLERDCCQVAPLMPPTTASLTDDLTRAAAHIGSLSFGPGLLEAVANMDWQTLADNHAACDFTQKHCILRVAFCGKNHSHMHHLKTQHERLDSQTIFKAAQLNHHVSQSTCKFCGVHTRTFHQCPIILQTALLLMKELCLVPSQRAVSPPRLTICELRHRVFEHYSDLKSHIAGSHQVPSLEFVKGRDSVRGEPACNHCGQLFESLAGLRQHVAWTLPHV